MRCQVVNWQAVNLTKIDHETIVVVVWTRKTSQHMQPFNAALTNSFPVPLLLELRIDCLPFVQRVNRANSDEWSFGVLKVTALREHDDIPNLDKKLGFFVLFRIEIGWYHWHKTIG